MADQPSRPSRFVRLGSRLFGWQRHERGSWRVLARSEIARLEDELKLAAAPPDLDEVGVRISPEKYLESVSSTVRERLSNAKQALRPAGPIKRLHDWYSGAALEQTWLSIHRASETLLMIRSPATMTSAFVEIDAAFRANVKPDDPRFTELAQALDDIDHALLGQVRPKPLGAALRGKLLAVLHAANVASDTAHETVRRWRNLLFVGGLALAGLAAVVAGVHALVPEFLSLAPPKHLQKGDAIEPWAAELMGCLGGGLAAVLALNRFSGFTDPAGLPVTQALLRIPTAAVTGLIGVVLMQTSALDVLRPQNGTTVLAYAFLFGYAQEPLLRMIDRQAGKVLDPARGKDEPAKPIPPAPPRLRRGG
jgi:hypothetical protein